METLLKIDDALAARMGMSRWGIYSAVRQGHITAVRLGRRLRVPSSEIERLIAKARESKAQAGDCLATVSQSCAATV